MMAHTMALFRAYGYADAALVAGSPDSRSLPKRGGCDPHFEADLPPQLVKLQCLGG